MRHDFRSFGTGDLIEQVVTQQLPGQNGQPGKMVARSRIGFIEERNGQQFKSSFTIEAWGQEAQALASIPAGHTIMFQGKVQNQSYVDQQGVTKWNTKIVAFGIASAGPSQYAQAPAQNPNAPDYGRQPNQGAGATPPAQGGWPSGGYGHQPQNERPDPAVQPLQQPAAGGGWPAQNPPQASRTNGNWNPNEVAPGPNGAFGHTPF